MLFDTFCFLLLSLSVTDLHIGSDVCLIISNSVSFIIIVWRRARLWA